MLRFLGKLSIISMSIFILSLNVACVEEFSSAISESSPDSSDSASSTSAGPGSLGVPKYQPQHIDPTELELLGQSSNSQQAGMEVSAHLSIPAQDIVVGQRFDVFLGLSTSQEFTGDIFATVFEEVRDLNGQRKFVAIHSNIIEDHTFTVGSHIHKFDEVFGMEPILPRKGIFFIAARVVSKDLGDDEKVAIAVSKRVNLKGSSTTELDVAIHSIIHTSLPAKANETIEGEFIVDSNVEFKAKVVVSIFQDGRLIHTAEHTDITIPAGSTAFDFAEVMALDPTPSSAGVFTFHGKLIANGSAGTYTYTKSILLE